MIQRYIAVRLVTRLRRMGELSFWNKRLARGGPTSVSQGCRVLKRQHEVRHKQAQKTRI